MQAVINAGHPRIVTIDSQNVLGEIVGSDRDKVYPVYQVRQHKHHRRNFQHDANARFWDRVADHLFHFASGAFNQTSRFVHFINAGDHRQQNAQVAGCRVGTQHGPNLDQKDLRLIERYADPTPAKARVLFTDRHVGQLFIGADIQRTQSHRLVVKHLQHALILRNLFFFRRKTALQHERDFGAIQANAVDPAPQLLFMLRAEARIEHHLHALATFQLCWLVDVIFRQAAQLNFFTDKTLVFLDQYRFWIDQQFTAITVHYQRTAV